MQTLAQTLQDHDRGHLKVIADLWGLDLPSDPHSQVVDGLSGAMLDRIPEILETLPREAKRALERMLESGGRAPMEALIRQFGPMREMGPGKRDRLEPWKEPSSALEMLWYRGLLAKAFADSASGPQEFGFVPDDLLEKMPEVHEPENVSMGNPASAPSQVIRSGSSAVDDAVTLLAAHRRAENVDHKWLLNYLRQPDSLPLIEELLFEAEIMESPELIRSFLELPRKQAFTLLQRTWRSSSAWNDLAHTPGVTSPTVKWPNDAVAGRQATLELLDSVPSKTWWSLSSLVEAVHDRHPGFMRPPGGFDGWYLQSSEDDSSLHGFEAWNKVEGQYLEYVITGPMLWLGLVEVSRDRSAFRLDPSTPASSVRDSAVAWPDGRIRVARGADRVLRYQIARICTWERMERDAYSYRLSARSLRAAKEQGLTASHASKVLSEISAPDSLLAAVARWNEKGEEAGIEHQTILRVKNPETLKMLLEHPTTKRYLLERLGSSTFVVDERHWHRLEEAALRLGLLIDLP